MKNLFKKENGITLIALIITIIVMLILVMVSIQIALDTGLFESAGKATKDWEEAQEKEGELSSGKVNIGGTVYNSIEEYTNSISGEVDFEKLFQTAEKHPDQSTENNDIGIAEDGSSVNLDLWKYALLSDGESYVLNTGVGSGLPSSYANDKIVDGKIQGKVPMYIKEEGTSDFYPVTSMFNTFNACSNLTVAPEIPSTVTDMDHTFAGCTSLTESPAIPSSVKNMGSTFYGCTSLTGTLTINANPTYYTGCLYNAATNEGCNLVLNGSSTLLNGIWATKSDNSNITIGN